MRVAILAIGLFVLAFLIHWVVWRIHLPRRQTLALFVIFFVTLPLGLSLTVLQPLRGVVGQLEVWDCLHLGLCHTAMTLAYVVVYYGLEERSPSMTILAYVADGGARGRSRSELESVVSEVNPVEIRLDGLVRDKMICEEAGGYHLTAKGRFWAAVFSAWLRLLKMDRGG